MRLSLCVLGVVSVCIPAGFATAIDVNSALPIEWDLTVQPIIVSRSDGTQAAEYFGNASQQTAITDYVDDIWAQAGINVDWLTPNAWNSTSAWDGTWTLSQVVNNGDAAGVDSDDPNVLNMYFVEGINGFGGTVFSENTAAGIAFRPGNGVTQYVGSDLLTFDNGRQVIASVVAHEIGHNLGLPHISEAFNLMQEGGAPNGGERLNSTQISIATGSPLLVAVNTDTPDLNGDGFVGVEDLEILLANWGDSGASTATGDANGDGLVNSADLDIVINGWGDGTPPSNLVPEPGTLAVLGLGGLMLLRRRRAA